MVQNKKLYKGIILGGILVLLIGKFGKQMILNISDIFQKNICVDSFCIQKPKGWIPYIVKKNNKKYFLNLIEDPDISTDPFLDTRPDGIMLYKDEEYITIFHFNKNKINKSSYNKVKAYNFLSKTYYIIKTKTFTTVFCLDDSFIISMKKFNKKIVEEILSYYNEKNRHKK